MASLLIGFSLCDRMRTVTQGENWRKSRLVMTVNAQSPHNMTPHEGEVPSHGAKRPCQYASLRCSQLYRRFLAAPFDHAHLLLRRRISRDRAIGSLIDLGAKIMPANGEHPTQSGTAPSRCVPILSLNIPIDAELDQPSMPTGSPGTQSPHTRQDVALPCRTERPASFRSTLDGIRIASWHLSCS